MTRMCGINGCTFKDRALVERMNAATAHRGPDGRAVYEGAQTTLGHNRLAIIDLSERGAQPMKSADGRFIITFNGEIYNYKELRAELSDYPFQSETDTEVIIAGFARWGTKIFERLNGIFAFALEDTHAGALFLVRDRAGIKPLYIARTKRGLVFSSEIKALLEDPEITPMLDTNSLHLYLRLGYVPGEETFFSGIRRFPAGHYARITTNTYERTRFAPQPTSDRDISGASAETQVRDTLDAAVKRQLISDRPLGVFLSGGIDSSTVVDSMSRLGATIDTYSVGFELPKQFDDEKFNADFLLARRTAAHYRTRHHEFLLSSAGLPALFEKVITHLDEPNGNATALAQFELCRLAKETVTVVLCGDGGDELFGGYPRYLMSRRMDMYQRFVPSQVRDRLSRFGKLAQLNTDAGPDRYALFHFIKDSSLQSVAPKYSGTIARDRIKEALDKNMSFGDAFMQLDREWWLRDESLMRTDKMSMASGLEARVPLLDNEMIALADRILLSEKVTVYETKRVLRRAMRGRLPKYLFDQPKRGWFSPSAKWLRIPEFNAYAREVLSPSYTETTRDLFNWKALEHAFEDHVEGRRYNLHMLWTILALQVWARTYNVRAPLS